MVEDNQPQLDPADTFCRAAKRILQIELTAVQEAETRMSQGDDGEALHDLRVGVRRLRVVMETFSTCFPRKRLKTQIRLVKQLSEVLGEVRDSDVMMAEVEKLSKDTEPHQRQSLAWVRDVLHQQRLPRVSNMREVLGELRDIKFLQAFSDLTSGN